MSEDNVTFAGCVPTSSSGKVTIWALRVKTLQSPQIQAVWLWWSSVWLRWSNPDIRSASVSDDTLSRHTALVPPKSNTEALYNLLMSHKVGQRWGRRRRSGFRFCWLTRFGRGVIVRPSCPEMIISRKESLGEVGLRLVIPVWLTGQGREGLTIWSRGGATHLSSARKTWQVTIIVIIMITMIANKIINKATKEPFKRNRPTEEKQGMCPAMWSPIENVWLDCKQISLLNHL